MAANSLRADPSCDFCVESLGEHIVSLDSPPMEVFGLVQAEAHVRFPPIRSLGALRHNVQPSPLPFIGRTDECVDILEATRRNLLTTLVGPMGIGKSALARAVAIEWLEAMGSCAFVVRVRASSTDASLRADLVNAVDADAVPSVALDQLLRASKALVLLDDCDQSPQAASELARDLVRIGTVAVLATARSSLGLCGERIVEVRPLSLPRGLGEDATLDSEAVRLFLVTHECMGASDRDVSLRDVARIVRLLDGNPALVMTGAIQAVAYGTESLIDNLALKSSANVARSRFARALERTWELLDEPTAVFLSRLSVLCPTWNADAAAAIGGVVPQKAIEHLKDLSNARLIEMTWDESGQVRFLMPSSILAFAATKLPASDRLETEARHFHYFLSRAESAYSSQQPDTEIARLDQEYPNIQLALMRAIETSSSTSARFLPALSRFWHRKRSQLEALSLSMAACALLDKTEHWAAPALNVRGTHEGASGFIDRARASHEESSSLATSKGDLLTAGLAQSNLVGVHKQLGNLQAALAAGELSLQLLADAGDPVRHANALNNHSTILHEVGRLREASECAVRALTIARDLDNSWLEGYCLGNLGEIALDSGELKTALSFFGQELGVGVETKDSRIAAFAIEGLSRTEKAIGNQPRATWLGGVAQAIRANHELFLSPSASRRLAITEGPEDLDIDPAGEESQINSILRWYT